MNVPGGINTNAVPMAGLMKDLSADSTPTAKIEAAIIRATMIDKMVLLFIIRLLAQNIHIPVALHK
jgi:hypothetical protein